MGRAFQKVQKISISKNIDELKEIKSLSTMELGSKYQRENESCYKGKFKVSRTDGV